MQQKSSNGSFFTDMQSTMKDMMDTTQSSNPFNLKNIMEAQRKNLQAVTEANQRMVNGWQALAQRQTEMMTQFVQDNAGLTRDAVSTTAPKDKIAKQAELMKSVYETSMANTKELAEMMTQCTKESAEVISQRIVSSMSEAKSAAKKTVAE